MRANTKLVSFLLCAVCLLGMAATSYAQATFSVSSNPNEVTQYGVTEVMGRVRLEMTAGTTQGSTLTVTYQGVTITNTVATGITVVGAGVLAGNVAVSQVIPTGGTGGQVILSITAGAIFGGAPNTDLITIDGVRADVSTKAVGTDIQASLSSSPSTANTFSNVSVVRVATVNEALKLDVTPVTDAICINPEDDPTVTVTEGFAGTFVQYVASAAGTAVPANPRALYGANKNTRVHIVVSPIPSGTTLTWPATVVDGVTGGTLELISQSTDGDDALYEFTTPDQAVSDANQESFDIVPDLVIDDDTDTTGSSTVQVRLEPQTTPTSTDIPRFNHPYINDPADTLLSIQKCTTNLLFPFLTNAVAGFDSGMAIVNTTADPWGTDAQDGTITVYFYGDAAPAPLTTPSVGAGSYWANSLSQIAPGFQGYAIAVCNFQFGHGFAFITGKYNSASVYDVAEGYVANVIPDPTFTGGVRAPAPANPADPAGENLGN